MDISVIIPSHNRAHTLPRAIDSVLAQDLQPREILVVDDGSTDATPALLRSRYPGVRYLAQKNLGVSAARNLGIGASRGEWLAFLDSDDTWLPGKLAAQADALAAAPGHRLCHTEEIWIRDGVRVNAMKKHAKSGGDLFLACLPLCVISPSAALIHRSLFDELGLFDETLPACEDYDLWLRICAREPVCFVAEPQIVKYGGHDDQLSRRHWGMDRFRVQALEKILGEGVLDAVRQRAAAEMLVKKASILAQGAARRGRLVEADTYRRLQEKYQPACRPETAGA
ncbi:MAG: glycosyltransferase family A protein [Pseudomonadota bacterium]